MGWRMAWSEPLRVALLAGTLDQGGAEKQLVYLARSLAGAGVETRVYSLTRGEFYERVLEEHGFRPVWAGPFGAPPIRLAALALKMRRFAPHVIQSTHAFANLYAGVLGRVLGAVSIGALRSSVAHARKANGRWTGWLLSAPDGLFVNSRRAHQELSEARSGSSGRVHFIPNVIELPEGSTFGRNGGGVQGESQPRRRAIFVGRLIPAKRLDRFLRALAAASRLEPALEGVVVGDGRCRGPMEQLAVELGLGPDTVRFLGRRDDVHDLLRAADMLVLPSDQEGFPNVLLEAMAAGLPVVTTPAGDSPLIVENEVTGYVVPHEDVDMMARRMIELARDPEVRTRMGRAGQQRVRRQYSLESLLEHVISAYREVAEQKGHRRMLDALKGLAGAF